MNIIAKLDIFLFKTVQGISDFLILFLRISLKFQKIFLSVLLLGTSCLYAWLSKKNVYLYILLFTEVSLFVIYFLKIEYDFNGEFEKVERGDRLNEPLHGYIIRIICNLLIFTTVFIKVYMIINMQLDSDMIEITYTRLLNNIVFIVSSYLFICSSEPPKRKRFWSLSKLKRQVVRN